MRLDVRPDGLARPLEHGRHRGDVRVEGVQVDHESGRREPHRRRARVGVRGRSHRRRAHSVGHRAPAVRATVTRLPSPSPSRLVRHGLAGLADIPDRREDRDLGLVGHEDPEQDTRRRSLDVEVDLLGLDLDDRLALRDRVALGLEPLLDDPGLEVLAAWGITTRVATAYLPVSADAAGCRASSAASRRLTPSYRAPVADRARTGRPRGPAGGPRRTPRRTPDADPGQDRRPERARLVLVDDLDRDARHVRHQLQPPGVPGPAARGSDAGGLDARARSTSRPGRERACDRLESRPDDVDPGRGQGHASERSTEPLRREDVGQRGERRVRDTWPGPGPASARPASRSGSTGP
jgi:hypothetical protein